MEPFKRSEDAQQFILQQAYELFRRTGAWPRTRDLDLQYGDLLDQVGGIEILTQQLGVELISSGSPTNPNDFTMVRLRGLARVPEAQQDLEKFVEADTATRLVPYDPYPARASRWSSRLLEKSWTVPPSE